ncbi:hypothetical protein DDB_G0268880 [Dictyostelium discoideum AX4]|uniref:Ataxin-10 homolog n=1 Tax=Dictyostelium discoideum TaxID=44689 RepID=ATX10_DICDI|nr:hypothetical protein DDB_G0268880 [Dictyostelium discoideum AX4]Q55EI6.1 RecName: Full=Ataxin-10 homolog [Dictyostelium discoideum]EAL73029.1 hypothetical protein DDB_G0268880 [Dictyostelium discoideum AX4]|eukprot:XP_647034.1 hypothetical protein DDB_G0268880 [Dictyostelium discoideum AX4]
MKVNSTTEIIKSLLECLSKEISNGEDEDTMITDITELFNLSKEFDVRKEISNKHNEFLNILMNYIIKSTTANGDNNEKLFKFNLTSIRFLRNLCANVSENQNIIISNSNFINFIINQLINENNNIKITLNKKNILTSLYQLLINGIVLNDKTQSLLWSNIYPNNLIILIEKYKDNDEFKLLPTNLMLIYNCILNSKDRMKDLVCNKRLVQLIIELIKEDDTFDHEYNTQNFHWIHLISKSLFINDLFIDLYKSLSDNKYSTELVKSTTESTTESTTTESTDSTTDSTTTTTTGKTNKNQVKLLNLLDSIIHDGDKKNIKEYIEKDSIIDLKTCYFMIDELASLYNLDFARKDLKVETQQLTTSLNQSDFDAIFFFIKIFANITSYTEEMLSLSLSIFKPNQIPTKQQEGEEDPVNQILNDPFSKDSAIDPSASKKFDLNTLLRKKGLVAICIGSLHGNYGSDTNKSSSSSSSSSSSTTTDGETVTSKGFNKNIESQDKGFKIELIRILGNLSYKNRGNQDEIRELGGIEIILNHCRFDVNNPYIKEWSVFAIRNLCEDNVENQNLIESLKVKGVANNDELKDLGLEVGVTENGTIKFKNVPKKEKENNQ